MAIKFVDEPPKSTRPGRASFFTEDVVKAIKDNSPKWAVIDATPSTAAKFVNSNDGFEYVTRTQGTKTNTKGKKVPDVKVYVRFNPQGKK